jgi:hypothetical protein
MVEGAKDSRSVAERVAFYSHRTREELYDFQNDPSALRNLAADTGSREKLTELRRAMEQHLRSTQDRLLPSYSAKTGT